MQVESVVTIGTPPVKENAERQLQNGGTAAERIRCGVLCLLGIVLFICSVSGYISSWQANLTHRPLQAIFINRRPCVQKQVKVA